MALDFEVNFRQAIQQVQDYQLRMMDLGKAMDALEAKGNKTGSAHTRLFTSIRAEADKVRTALKDMGMLTEKTAKSIGIAEQQISRSVAAIGNRYLQAGTQALGFSQKGSQLHNVLSNTARLEAYSRWQRQVAALYEDQAGRAEFLQSKLQYLRSAEGRHVNILEAKVRATERANKADVERRARVADLQRELAGLDSIAGRQITRLEQELRARKQALTYLERQAARTAELKAQQDFLASSEGQQQTRLAQQNRARQQQIGYLDRQAARTAELKAQQDFLASSEGQQQVRLAQQNRAREQQIGYLTRQAARTAELKAQQEFLASSEGQQQVRLAQQNKDRERQITHLQRQAARTAELKAQQDFLNSSEGQQQVRLAAQNRAREQQIGYLERQSAKTAELKAQQEFLASAEGQQQVRLAAQNRAREQQIGYIERQAAKTAELRAQLEFLNSAAGREQQQLSVAARARQAEVTFLERQAVKTAELRAEIDFLGTAQGRELARLKQLARHRREEAAALGQSAVAMDAHVQARTRAQATASNYLTIVRQLTQAEREMAVTGERLAWGYERLTQAQAALSAQQQRAKAAIDGANKAMVEGEQNLHRYTGANAAAEQASRRLADQEARANAQRTSQMAQLRAAIEQRAAADQRYQENARKAAAATRTLTESEARNRVERQRAIAGAEAYNQAMQRNAAATRDAGAEGTRYAAQLNRVNAAMLTSPAEQLNQQFTHLARSGRSATSSLQALSTQQASLTASEERANRLLQLRNRLTMDQARANQMRSGTEAQLTREIERQIAVQARRNRLMGMTTAELLGLSSANRKLGRDFRATAQAAAMFRAGLTGLHASIGIYTGGTVLAAASTYAVAAALRSTVTAGMEFTETMSRAEAVMMTGIDSFTAAGRSMESVEMMVRALGASTIFTATQVSGGLVDLGMAGLSAGDAMTALAPALNLASIGGIEMSRAADIATNVMTSFNLTASDLTEVVDVMATAITNSNTNIEQLANALSYVGPAAQAAGFELRDTVAAIELLSSAGIKSSKAGTGLRRFMLNIQNPTSKGAAVLERFGISIVDAEGQTRSMIDILGQFNRALHNDAITPAERTAAIMDLVGVRAQSAVSRMIGSFDEFGALRRQLDEVEGAAEAMRKTIEANLTADWKQLKSAFQDVQLDVFSDYQHHLRELAASWRLTFMEMQETVEGQDYTGIELLISRLDRAKDAAMGIGVAFLALKGSRVASTMFMAGAENAQAFADRLKVLNTRAMYGRAGFAQMQVQLKGLSAAFMTHVHGVTRASSAYSGLTAAAYTAGTALTYVARAASLILAAAGWVGVIWGAYTAVRSLFARDTEQRIDRHNERVENAKQRYKELQDAIESTTEARMKAALQARREEARTELEGTREAITKLTVTLEYITDEGSRQRLEDQLLRQELRAKELETQVNDTTKALGQIGVNQAQHRQLESQLVSLASLYADNRVEISNLQSEQARLNSTSRDSGRETRALGQELTRLGTITQGLEGVMALLGHRVDDVASRMVNFTAMTRDALAAQRDMLDEAYTLDNMSDHEKLNHLLLRRQEIQDRISQLDMNTDAGVDTWERLNEQALAVGKEIHALEMNRQEAVSEGMELEAERQRLVANEEPTLAAIAGRLREINAEREAMFNRAASGEELWDIDRANELRKEENRLLGEQNQLRERAASEAQRLGEANRREAERAAEAQRRETQQLLSNYQAIREAIYPVEGAQRKYREEVETITEAYTHLKAAHEHAVEHFGAMSEEALTAADALFDYNQVLEDHRRLNAFTDKKPGDVYEFLDTERFKDADEDLDALGEAARQAARNMQSHFADFLFDPFDEGLKGMLDGFATILQRMVAEAVAADLMNRIFGEQMGMGGQGNGWIGALAGLFGAASGGGATAYGGGGWAASATSFSGGGFTGWGARAGGVDGKGGFPAILHPRETVIDHTKDGGRGAPTQNITNNFLLQERRDNRTQQQVAMKAAQGQRRASSRLGA